MSVVSTASVESTAAGFALASLLQSASPYLGILTPIPAALLGYWLALRRFRAESRTDFVRRQLELLYSPMVGCIRRIRASSSLRVDLQNAADTAWKQVCAQNPEPFLEHDAHFEPFRRQIADENRRFPEYLLPLYDEMVDTFTSQYWLSEPSTREFYEPFCRFVEMWHRHLDDGIPSHVLEIIPIEEAPLNDFYDDVERQMLLLRDEIANERVRLTRASTRQRRVR